MSAMDGGDRQLHIVVFPWLAFGHMIPFLELSKGLAKRGHLISFLSTPRNIRRLPKIPPHLSPLINLVELHLPPTEGLPEDAESTMDLTLDKVQYLKKALDGLEPQVAGFLEAVSPAVDWVVHDFVQHWIARAAARATVPCAFFSVLNPWAHALLGPPATTTQGESWPTPEQLMTPRPWTSSAPWLVLRPHEAEAIAALSRPNASGVSDARRLQSAIEGCGVFALRVSEELDDPEWLALIREHHHGKAVVSVGLLPASVQERSGGRDVAAGAGGGGDVFEWLGKQAAASVVYVAFGSEAELSPELIHELAFGLEQSELPFLWALRKPPGSPDGADLLPQGFQDRVAGRGSVTMEWVPQMGVLAHPSVGAFLTHCGWSSVIEGLTMGRPLVLLPLFADQCTTARVMAQRKVGLEIPRDDVGCGFTRDGVAGSLRLLMVGEQGEAFRANAQRAGELFGDKARHDRCVDDLVRCLRTLRQTATDGAILQLCSP